MVRCNFAAGIGNEMIRLLDTGHHYAAPSTTLFCPEPSYLKAPEGQEAGALKGNSAFLLEYFEGRLVDSRQEECVCVVPAVLTASRLRSQP